MSTAAALIGLGIAAAGATAGAIGSSANNKKAKAEADRNYKSSLAALDKEYYRDPLSTVGNRALLKSLDQKLKDQNEAMQNRAIAGGATMENQLAARKANNETMSNVYSNLLQGEDERRAAIQRQKLALGQNYSTAVQQGFYRQAQDWQTWGAQVAKAGMALGTSSLLGSTGSSTAKAAAEGVKFADLAPAAPAGTPELISL